MFDNKNICDTDCPLCGAKDSVETGFPQVDGPSFWVDSECSACHKTWRDYYDVTSMSVRCPSCGSTNLIGATPQADGPDGWVEMECQNCSHLWTDTYTYANSEEK